MDFPWTEGIARFCSSLLTYGLEADKTFLQVHGRLPARLNARVLVSSVCQSAMTSGIVYQLYYSVHRGIGAHVPMAAGVGAAVATAVLKIPLSNCFRVMQAAQLPSFVHAGRNICRANGPVALYAGSMWSIAEDIIEMDVRVRLYDALVGEATGNIVTGFAAGAASGGIAAALTVPFDNVRSVLAYHASERGAMDLGTWWRQRGPSGLYRGARLRAIGTGLKTAYFYAFVESIRLLSKKGSAATTDAQHNGSHHR